MSSRVIRDPWSDKIMYAVFNFILISFTIIVLYPCIFVVSASFSDPVAVSRGRIILWPVNFSMDGFNMVFSHRMIMTGYRNTIFYTVAGTLINLIITIFAAYPMSRGEMPFRGFFMAILVFTMFFGGGIVPSYMLMNMLGVLDTVWVMILPVYSVFNMILMRTNFQSLPEELHQAAEIDGCSYWQYLIKVTLPLTKPVLSVITLFYAVGHWNAFFGALMYLSNRELYPLQLVLRSILLASQIMMSDLATADAEFLANKQGMADLIKYSVIVASAAPLIMVYPFIQKYFVKGIMIGSLKG